MDIKASDPIEITLSQSQSMDSVIGVNEEEVSALVPSYVASLCPCECVCDCSAA